MEAERKGVRMCPSRVFVSTDVQAGGRNGRSLQGYVSDVQSGDVTVPDGTCHLALPAKGFRRQQAWSV